MVEFLDESHEGVVWICSYLPTGSGSGVERFIDDLSTCLAAKGITTKVVDAESFGSLSPWLVKIRPIAAWAVGRKVNRTSSARDVIVCNGFFSWNARRTRSMIVYHGTEAGRAAVEDRGSRGVRWLWVNLINSRLERAAGKGRTIVCVSPRTAEEVKLRYGHRVDRVLLNAVNLNLFRPSSSTRELRGRLGLPVDKFLALYVGPPNPRKGVGWIVEHICPRLNDREHLVLRTDINVDSDEVTVIKKLSRQDLADLYKACDVLLLPSLYEGCSFTIAEALACGLPTITSPETGSAALIAQDTVLSKYLVPGRNADAYIRAMRILSTSSEERKRASDAARAFAVSYHDIDVFCSGYHDLVRKLLDEKTVTQ